MKKQAKTDLGLSKALGCSLATARKLRKEDGLIQGPNGYDIETAKKLLQDRWARKKGQGQTQDQEVLKWRKLFEEYRARFKKLEYELAAQKAKSDEAFAEALKKNIHTFIWLVQKEMPERIGDKLITLIDDFILKGERDDRKIFYSIKEVAQQVAIEGLNYVGQGKYDPDKFCCSGEHKGEK